MPGIHVNVKRTHSIKLSSDSYSCVAAGMYSLIQTNKCVVTPWVKDDAGLGMKLGGSACPPMLKAPKSAQNQNCILLRQGFSV